MPKAPKIETSEQREARLVRQRAYEARRRAKDPAGYAKAQAESTARHRLKHKDRVKDQVKRWRNDNRDSFNAARRIWRSKNLSTALLSEARRRASKRGVEFNLTADDLPEIGEFCPLLGHPFPIERGRRSPFAPSLDRIDPKKGYVKGNVWFVGYRANLLKNDGTAEEHEAIASAMRLKLSSSSPMP